jgi:hypothetical protein
MRKDLVEIAVLWRGSEEADNPLVYALFFFFWTNDGGDDRLIRYSLELGWYRMSIGRQQDVNRIGRMKMTSSKISCLLLVTAFKSVTVALQL